MNLNNILLILQIMFYCIAILGSIIAFIYKIYIKNQKEVKLMFGAFDIDNYLIYNLTTTILLVFFILFSFSFTGNDFLTISIEYLYVILLILFFFDSQIIIKILNKSNHSRIKRTSKISFMLIFLIVVILRIITFKITLMKLIILFMISLSSIAKLFYHGTKCRPINLLYFEIINNANTDNEQETLKLKKNFKESDFSNDFSRPISFIILFIENLIIVYLINFTTFQNSSLSLLIKALSLGFLGIFFFVMYISIDADAKLKTMKQMYNSNGVKLLQNDNQIIGIIISYNQNFINLLEYNNDTQEQFKRKIYSTNNLNSIQELNSNNISSHFKFVYFDEDLDEDA